MRPVHSLRPVMSTLALLASAAALPLSAHAQTMPTPTPVAMPMPAPAPILMPAPVSDMTMDIPTPAGSTVQVEMDIHDDDLLGVYKSFLSGIGQGIQTNPVYYNVPASPGSSRAQVATILSNADLGDMLKGTTHIHMIVFKTPGSPAPAMPLVKTTTVLKKSSKKTVVIMSPPAPVIMPPPSPMIDETGFYETAFGAEGGRRILFVNIDPVHMTMVSFGHTRGYAVMVQVPGTLAVMRADGYPDLSKLSALMTQVSTVAAKAALDSVNSHKKSVDDH